jgi:phosphate starvation-inducible PhoH-like protein
MMRFRLGCLAPVASVPKLEPAILKERMAREFFPLAQEDPARSDWPGTFRNDPHRGDSARGDQQRRARIEIAFEEQTVLGALFGQFDQNLVQIENRLARRSARGKQAVIEGPDDAVARARDVLKGMHQRLLAGHEVDLGCGRVADHDVERADAGRDHHWRTRRRAADHDPHTQEDDRPGARPRRSKTCARVLVRDDPDLRASVPARAGKSLSSPAVAQAVAQLTRAAASSA